MERKMRIDGMKCNHCKANVEKALCAIPGVTGAEVNLEEKTALIRTAAEVSDQILMDAVAAKGFQPIDVTRL